MSQFVIILVLALIVTCVYSQDKVGIRLEFPSQVIRLYPFQVKMRAVNSMTSTFLPDYNKSWQLEESKAYSGLSMLVGSTFKDLSTKPSISFVNGECTVTLKATNSGNIGIDAVNRNGGSIAVSSSNINVLGTPDRIQLDMIEGSFKSGEVTKFSVSLLTGLTRITVYQDSMKISTNPLLKGFPMESIAVNGVARFSGVVINEPKAMLVLEAYILGNVGTGTVIKEIPGELKFMLNLTKSEITPGESFGGFMSLYDSYGNFLDSSKGSSKLIVKYNGNQQTQVIANVREGRVLEYPSISIEKIYSSPIYVQASYTPTQTSRVFYSEFIPLYVNNVTAPEPVPTLSVAPPHPIPTFSALPQSSIPKPIPSKSIRNETKPMTSSQPKDSFRPVQDPKISKRLNDSCIIGSSIYITLLSILMTLL